MPEKKTVMHNISWFNNLMYWRIIKSSSNRKKIVLFLNKIFKDWGSIEPKEHHVPEFHMKDYYLLYPDYY